MRTNPYDVAVAGGGVGAVFHACSLAVHGYKVVILAEGGSLMQELGLSRLPFTEMSALAARYPIVRAWLELLERHGGVQGDFVDPVWVQLLADTFVRELGIDVIFEVVPVSLLAKGVQIATREGLWEVPSKVVSDCSESALLAANLFGTMPVAGESERTFWMLTTLNGDRLEQPLMSRCGYDGAVCDIRIVPGCRENEHSIMVAVTAEDRERRGELAFLGALEHVLLELKRSTGFECGDLVHVSELSWSTPAFVLEAVGWDYRHDQDPAAWVSAPDGRFVAIGCWTAAAEAAIRRAPLWEKGGAAVRLLVEGAFEAARYVHERLTGTGAHVEKTESGHRL